MSRALLVLLLAGCAEPRPMIVVHPDGTQESLEDCNRGCSAPTPDETHALTEAELNEALAQIADAPVGVDSEGLDTLLFHFSQVPELLARHGHGPLTDAHRAWLDAELSRQTVDIAFRLVDEGGTVLGHVGGHIPLKTKQHLILEGTGPLKRIDVNGKTKRVGLHHLWSRW